MSLGYFRTDCRLCRKTQLETFLDFGMHPHSDGFLTKEQLHAVEPFFPLACAACTHCGQVQLTYVVSPEHLYNASYVYDGSVTKTGQEHYYAMATTIVEKFTVTSNDLVIDIGSNVGLLLSGFKENGAKVLGVDPAVEPTKLAKERGIDTIVQCFSEAVAQEICKSYGRAKVITGTNVFAHIDDLDDFMAGVRCLLSDDGVLVVESPYLQDLIDNLEYDTIYHQHLSYLAIGPLVQFFQRFNMELFDVIHSDIHGGSIRLFVGKKGQHAIEPIVTKLQQQEESSRLCELSTLQNFAKKVAEHRTNLLQQLVTLHDQGKSIYGVGAPAKGMTLLNYCGLHEHLIPKLTEKSSWKQGKYAPGVHIPIASDDALMTDKPDYALILAWNFAPEIMQNLHAYKEAGGSFILPIPSPTLL